MIPLLITKRLVLKSIAEIFDIFNYAGPLLNRARIFMHSLQLREDLAWDTTLPAEMCNEWGNVCKQFNLAPMPTIPRFVGRRDGNYKLIAFVDSSKLIYGVVLYIFNVDTSELHFLLAKSKMIGKSLEGKSTPSLELLSITLGVETLVDIKESLTCSHCYNPIKINELVLYSDSIVALSWVNSFFVKLSKMNKQSVFVMNRLQSIRKYCDKFPVSFNFIDGVKNPGDCITRPLSFNLLSQSNYWSGSDTSSLTDVA